MAVLHKYLKYVCASATWRVTQFIRYGEYLVRKFG